MKSVLFSFLLLSLITINTAKAQTAGLTKEIDSLLTIQTEKPFNGVLLIAQNKKVIYSNFCGYSDLEHEVPLKIDDQFVVGSVSKQFTTAIVLQEHDKGRLDLHLPIIKYLPDLPEQWADTVTTHHLLTHTHGIKALDQATLFPVGTQYNYSQIGFDLLAKIVEKTSGRSFVELSSALFNECNMNNTFHPKKKEYRNLVKGYVENDQGIPEYTNESLMYYPAAGAFISSAGDLHVWNQLFFEGKLLKHDSFKAMTTRQEKALRDHPVFGLTAYGYGITIDEKDGLIQWGQTGLAPGFVSMNFYFPHNKTSVIVLENIEYDEADTKKTFYYHTRILDIVRNELH